MTLDARLKRTAGLLVSEWGVLQEAFQGLLSPKPSILEQMTLSEIEGVLEQIRSAVAQRYGSLCSVLDSGSDSRHLDVRKRVSIIAASAMNACAIAHLPRGTPVSGSAMYRSSLELGLDEVEDGKMMHSAFEMLSLMTQGREYTEKEIVQEFRNHLEICEHRATVVARAFLERYERHIILRDS